MKTRDILVIAGIVGVVGVAGYFMGSRSSVDWPSSSISTGGEGQDIQSYSPSGQSVDYAEVLGELKDRLKKDPGDFQTLSRLGDTYFELMNFDEAVRHYKKALMARPDDVDTYNDLGLASHYMGDSAQGINYVDEGIKKNPYYQRIWLTRGFIMAYGMGDQAKAVESWEKARSIAPDTPVGKAAADYLAEFNRR